MLQARGTACIFSRICQILITVFFEFYFLAFYLVLHYIRITFFMNILSFLGSIPLASRISGGLENTTGYREVLHAFKLNLAHFIYFLLYGKTYLQSMLVSYCYGVTL